MLGFDAPYVPGWDCHGLPIEQKVDKQLGSKMREMDAVADPEGLPRVRAELHRHPARGVPAAGRRRQLEAPVPTMTLRLRGGHRARLRRVLREGPPLPRPEVGALVLHGPHGARRGRARVRGARGPGDHVAFPIADPATSSSATTTVEPEAGSGPSSGRRRPGRSPRTSRSRSTPRRRTPSSRRATASTSSPRSCAEAVAKDAGWTDWKIVHRLPGSDLAGVRYRHPLPPESRGELTPEEAAAAFRIVPGDYVTMDAGTGLVHTAPGPRRGRLPDRASARACPILSPVDEGGRYTTVAKYKGKKVLDANAEIVEDLRAAGALLAVDPKFRHEYPHCWRCKKPVIFRATVQWFVRLDDPRTDVRAGALAAIRRVQWIPPWGEARIAGMVENRREWVVSRQRRWGSPDHAPLRDARRRARRGLPVEGLARGAAEVLRAARRDLPQGGRRRLVRAAGRGLPAAGRRPPRLRRLREGDRHPRRLVRLGRLAPRRAALRRVARARRRPAGSARGRLPRGPRPAPRLVPVVAADVGGALRRRALPGGHHARLLPGRLGAQDVEVARQRRRAAGAHPPLRRRHPPALGLLARLPGRHADLRGDPGALRRGVPEDPQHRPLPDLEPLRLRPGRGRGARRTRSSRSTAGPSPWPASWRSGSSRPTRTTSSTSSTITLVNFCATTLSAFYLDILKDRLYASRADSPRAAVRADRDEPDRPGPRDSARARCFRSPRRRSGRPCPGKKEESVHYARFETLDDAAGRRHPPGILGTTDASCARKSP